MIAHVLVYGTTREEYDQRLRLVLSKSKDVTLNKKKAIGHVVSADGLKPV